MSELVIGVGNEYRRDDGIGPRLISELAGRGLPGVRLAISDGEPMGLIEQWADAELTVLVDAVLCEPSAPGTIHRTLLDGPSPGPGATSSHGLGVPAAVALGRVLGLLPGRLVVLAVEAADVALGIGLGAEVAMALPQLVDAVVGELAV